MKSDVLAARRAIAGKKLTEQLVSIGTRYGLTEQVDAVTSIKGPDKAVRQLKQMEATVDLLAALDSKLSAQERAAKAQTTRRQKQTKDES